MTDPALVARQVPKVPAAQPALLRLAGLPGLARRSHPVGPAVLADPLVL